MRRALVFHKLVHVSVRRAHNDLAGFTIAVIGVLYAVLLAFIAIATGNLSAGRPTWSKTNQTSPVEYTSIPRDCPQAKGQPIRDAAARYVNVVINEKWPVQRAGKTPDQGWKPLRELNTAIATIQPQNLGEAVIQAELLKAWNELYQTRGSRLSAVQGHVPGVV